VYLELPWSAAPTWRDIGIRITASKLLQTMRGHASSGTIRTRSDVLRRYPRQRNEITLRHDVKGALEW